MHVVFGASGRAGGETARALVERGEPVRVVVRRRDQGEPWLALGAEVAVADFDDGNATSAALAGARTAFLINPPPVAGDPFAQAEGLGAALAEAIRGTRLPKAVVLSSVGAQHRSGTGVIATLHRFEAALSGSSSAVAFLRPGYFMETWEEVAGSAVAERVLPTFLEPDRKIPMVSTMDVGRAAARLMSATWTGTRIVELGGPEEFSAADVATAFADVLGYPVEPLFVPPDERAAMLAEAGLPAEVVSALLGMYEGIANGRVARENGTEHWRGTVPLRTAVERIVARGRASARQVCIERIARPDPVLDKSRAGHAAGLVDA